MIHAIDSFFNSLTLSNIKTPDTGRGSVTDYSTHRFLHEAYDWHLISNKFQKTLREIPVLGVLPECDGRGATD